MMVMSMSFILDLRTESMLVGFIVNVAYLVIWLDNGIESFEMLSITGLPLTFNIVMFWIMDGVVEMIDWMTLEAFSNLIMVKTSNAKTKHYQ